MIKTVHRYLLKDFLVTFSMALSVMTLMLYMGSVMRGLDYVARGVPGGVLLKIFTLNMPYLLTFSIPISTVVATLLMFGRLSTDGEFTAMRAGGLSTWQIVSPIIFAGGIFTLLCLVIHYEIAPESRFARRTALVSVDELDPMDLLDEGRFVSFPGLEVWITRKRGNEIEDVEIYELDKDGKPTQTVRARDGVVRVLPDLKAMRVTLNDVQIQHPDPDDPQDLTKAHVIDMDAYAFNLDYAAMMKNNQPTRNIKDMRARQLLRVIRDVDHDFPNLPPPRKEEVRMKAIVETHKRLGLSMACLSFVLLGIPLGMTNPRKESHAGIPIGLSMVIVFYAFIMTADSLRYRPWLLPDYIIWIPVIASQLAGLWMIRKLP
jgi:lipopolysaccharide export LptBFGC system permease protein LptF